MQEKSSQLNEVINEVTTFKSTHFHPFINTDNYNYTPVRNLTINSCGHI